MASKILKREDISMNESVNELKKIMEDEPERKKISPQIGM